MNPADQSELELILKLFTTEIKLIFSEFLNPETKLFKLINAARWLDIRTVKYTADEKLNKKSFESALDYLLEFYLTIKPDVLVPYENSSSQSNESCWDSEDDSSTETTARQAFMEKIWNNERVVYKSKVSATISSINTLQERQSYSPLLTWKSLEKELPHLSFIAKEILAIPAQSAGAERIFSAMNTIVTKTRCRLKQNNIGPLVESSLRFKQDRRQKERITAQEGLPPFGSFHIDLLEVDDANDGADIDDNVSEISATSSLPLSDISDLDEFPTVGTDNSASTTQNHQPIDEEMEFFED